MQQIHTTELVGFNILAEAIITPDSPAQLLTFFKGLDRDTFVGGPYRTCFELDPKERETNLAGLDKEGGKATDLFLVF